MFKWRLLVDAGRKVGHTFSQPDLIIAATALHNGLIVVTRDRSVMTGQAGRFSIPGPTRCRKHSSAGDDPLQATSASSSSSWSASPLVAK
jgi:hypothetical protein